VDAAADLSAGFDLEAGLFLDFADADHSDIRVTRGYTHVSSMLAQDAAARLGRALFGKTATRTAAKSNDH